ncbi:ferritin-like domain-containing protein [Pseudoalteromonas piscicida]|uniref:Iminophenyl-pyruvate dimer synthase domain-containing protein n=1 Tax=Pseudoalteromonas piscicida TaxID=43662 RepID=A0AAD0W5W5_PSEO7|nr:ferritin-like domain-containing protein [Pseudoalteromonas piscicida]ASD69615.1 hypothetical protein B1L02_22395 [Pseudoalteromonas piscicida]AXR04026.1 hypothetical protein D0511_18860 [Pseudoalteromonas piscicida]
MNVQNKTGPSVEVDKEIDANILLSSAQKQQIKARSSEYKAADLSCLKAIAQAAINVELFTIPLYMTGLYSIQGTHQIADSSNLYPGRYWPGLGPTAGYIPSERLSPYDNDLKDRFIGISNSELNVNEQVFNGVYSVFIEEMLHLQLASNMASKLGLTPSFTSQALIDEKFGWKCYNNQSGIPHILDFADCTTDLSKLSPEVQAYFEQIFPGKTLQDLRVNATELNKEQTLLFMLIEETEENAKKIIQPQFLEPDAKTKQPKYFEQAPYDWWKPDYTESDLPLFGSIGHMYLSYWDYIQIEYDDNTSLLDYALSKAEANDARAQRNYFNERPGDTSYDAQFPKIKGSLEKYNEHNLLKKALINNVNAITDQGEGDGVAKMICLRWAEEPWAQSVLGKLQSAAKPAHPSTVDARFQPDEPALEHDYPSTDDKPLSGSACARIANKYKDHFQIFTDTMKLIVSYEKPTTAHKERYLTWPTWFAEGNSWTEALLDPNGGDEAHGRHPQLPPVDSVVHALNNLRETDKKTQETNKLFSQSAVGTIKGLTSALDRYWSGKTTEFPGPAMGGSGDRISICWATTGIAPDLVTGIAPQNPNTLYHACQGMSYTNIGSDDLPPPEVYHSCKGSNDCKAQGGCGFVHSTTPGGSCGGSVSTGPKSAPADNKCNNLGGCAVPISASQLFPKLSGEDKKCFMQLFKFNLKDNSFSAIDYTYPKDQEVQTDEPTDHVLMPYETGDAVYNIAWQAYCNANGLLNEEGKPKEKPKPSDIRLALPPST